MVSLEGLIQRNQKCVLRIPPNFDFVEQSYLTSDNQSPNTIVITCSYSRVLRNIFPNAVLVNYLLGERLTIYSIRWASKVLNLQLKNLLFSK